MSCHVTDERLWSTIDRGGHDLDEHIAECSECQSRAAELRAEIGTIQSELRGNGRPLPEFVGPYRVLSLLGEGGMGIVYEAEQISPRRKVAVKVVRGGAHIDEYRVRLFKREADTLAQLKHPSIAAIYEAGLTEDGCHYFAMEHVAGQPLSSYIREKNPTLRERLKIFRQVCSAIAYAHQRGVIHRDLKPSNVIIDSDGQARVLDFGLAQIADSDAPQATTLVEAGRIMGTLPYMSPEEARGSAEGIDTRRDVYSLGVILYEMVTGELPFKVAGLGLPDAVRSICEDYPKRPGQLNLAARGDVETIVLRAMERDPARRYQTVLELSEDVRRFLVSEPIQARPPSLFYHGRKFIERHRGAAVLTVVMVAVVLGASWLVLEMQSSNQETQQLAMQFQDLIKAIELHDAAVRRLEAREFESAEKGFTDALWILQNGPLDNSQWLRWSAKAKAGLGDTLFWLGDDDEAEWHLTGALRILLRDFPNQPELRLGIYDVIREVYKDDSDSWFDDYPDFKADWERLDNAREQGRLAGKGKSGTRVVDESADAGSPASQTRFSSEACRQALELMDALYGTAGLDDPELLTLLKEDLGLVCPAEAKEDLSPIATSDDVESQP